MNKPSPGDELDGYTYLGGDPNSKDSWKLTYDPTEGMSTGEKVLVGVGRGMHNVGRQVGNMMGLVDDETLAEYDRTDEALMNTRSGQVGSFLGEVAATAPIGGLAGAGVKAAGGRLAGRAAALGREPGVFAKALQATPVQAASMGATEGAVLGGPDNRGVGAALGGVLGGGVGGVGKLLKKATSTGTQTGQKALIPTSQAADDLSAQIGEFIPLSQAAEEGSIGRMLYEGIVANLPGGGQRVRGQFKKAVDALRHYAAEESIPPNTPDAIVDAMRGKPMNEVFSTVDDVWKRAWDGFNQVPVVLFKDVYKGPSKKVRKMLQGKEKIPNVGDTVVAQDLLSLKTALSQMMSRKYDDLGSLGRGQIKAAMDNIDATLKRNFDPSGKGKGKYAKAWREVNEPEFKASYQKYLDLKAAIDKAGLGSKVKPIHIATASAERAGNKGRRGEGGLQALGEEGAEVLQDFPSKQGIFQIGAALGILGQLTGLGLAGVGAGGPLGRKGTQKFLSGKHGWQQRMAERLRKNQSKLRGVGSATRVGALSEQFDKDYE